MTLEKKYWQISLIALSVSCGTSKKDKQVLPLKEATNAVQVFSVKEGFPNCQLSTIQEAKTGELVAFLGTQMCKISSVVGTQFSCQELNAEEPVCYSQNDRFIHSTAHFAVDEKLLYLANGIS